MPDDDIPADESPPDETIASPDSPTVIPTGYPTQTVDPADSSDAVPTMPATIGHYKILRKLGEGGMGVVYLAEQESPRRQVAVKVVRGGQFVDEHHVRLFRREAETLALLKHPNIGAIYESGRTEDGQHFFAMELVQGVTLDTYMKKRPTEVTVEELRFRLALFRKIADAVHYAHQRGVIHRDLKPSNLIVAEETTRGDSVPNTGSTLSGLRLPEIKILDFGLARITEGDLAAATMTTEIGVIKGTLPYMSPEQARGRPEEIDVRTDVYALGVILYEMLSGQRPYDVMQKALVEAVRVICEEPPRPLRESLCSVRKIDPDVETIVGKALEKDAERRYANAMALSEDVSRYLTSQPIVARPSSAVYQLRKFAARNRALVGGVVATLLVLVAGIVVSTVLGLRAVQERDEANRHSYVANVAAAEASLRLGGTADARQRLSNCPPELRGWEWEYLWSRTDRSTAALVGHEHWVQFVAFSPGGQRLASVSRDKTVRLWDAQAGKLLATLTGHKEEVHFVAFSPDGTRFASRSGDGMILVWGAVTGELQATIAGGATGFYRSMAFDPDGRRLASNFGDKTVRLWDVETGELQATLTGHEEVVSSVAFSPDGARLASASRDKTIRLWDAESTELVTTLVGHDGSINSISFNPDGTRLASASRDGTVRVWDAATGVLRATLAGGEGPVNNTAFSPDGSILAAAASGNSVRLWTVATGDLLATLVGHEAMIWSVSFSPDGTLIATSSVDRTVRLWNPATGELLAKLVGHGGPITRVTFSPDGTQLASASQDKTVRLWDARSTDLPATLTGHKQLVKSVAYSPDGTRVASCSQDRTVRLWDTASGEMLAILVGHDGWLVNTVVFSPDGSKVASAASEIVRLWDAVTGELLTTLLGPAMVHSVAFSPDGTLLASASANETVVLWNLASGEMQATLVGHEADVRSVAFIPNASRLASGSRDKTVRLWDTASGDLLVTLEGHEEPVSSVAFSPGGKWLASASWDKTVRLWNATSNELQATLVGHDGGVQSVSFSPDGARLASGSDDRTVRLWDAVTGEPLATLAEHDHNVTSVAFSPDGTLLVSGSWDKTVRLWDGGSGPRSAADTESAREFITAFHGRFLIERQRFEAAEPLLREALELRNRDLSRDGWRTADATSRLGESLAGQGKLGEAEPLLVDSFAALLSDAEAPLEPRCRALARLVQLETARSASGDESPTLLVQRVALRHVGARGAADRPHAARLLLACAGDERDWMEAALAIAIEAVETTDDPELSTLETLAEAHRRSGDTMAAHEVQRRALSLVSDGSPLEAARVEGILHVYEIAWWDFEEKYGQDEAIAMLERGLEARRRYLGDDHRSTLATLHTLGHHAVNRGKLDEAEAYYREALEGRRRVLGPEAYETLVTLEGLAILFRIQGRHDKAEPLYRELLELRRRTLPEHHPWIGSTLMLFGFSLNAQERYAEAEPLLRECLEIRREVFGPGHWLTYNTMSVVGESLLGQGRYAEAEPLLIEGCESMRPPRNAMARKKEALERVVRLYGEWGKPEKEEEWRLKLGSTGGG